MKTPPASGRLFLLHDAALRQVTLDDAGYVIDSEGAVFETPPGYGYGIWNPDGQLAALVGCTVVNSRGDEQFQLRPDHASPCYSAWSADGSMLAYLYQAGRTSFDLGIVKSGGEQVQAMHLADSQNYELVGWKPDGSGLLLVMDSTTLVTLDLGGQMTQLPRPDGVKITIARWFDDGRHILFSGEVAAGTELWVVDADGGSPRRLACLSYRNAQALPTCAQAVLEARSHQRACETPAAETGRFPCACDTPAETDDYTWGLHGAEILYSYDLPCRGSVHSINVATGEDVKIAEGVAHLDSYHSPADLSPDGRNIVVEFPDGSLYVYRADGKNRTKVGEGGFPTWSPDGEYIAFLGRDGNLYSIRPDGSDLTQLTDDGARFYPVQWLR